MAKKITVTVKELTALRGAKAVMLAHDGEVDKGLESLLAKAEAAHAPVTDQDAAPGVSLSAVERAFLRGAGKSGAALGGLSPREAVMMTRDIKERGVTPEQAEVLGRWLAGQKWFRGHATLRQALNNWASWYGRARVEKPRSHGTAPAAFEDVSVEEFTEVNRGGGTP